LVASDVGKLVKTQLI